MSGPVTKAVDVVQVCADYSPESGGTTASVRQFQRAMGGAIIAFQGSQISPPSDRGVLDIRCDAGFAGRSYRWAPRAARVVAAERLSKANLVVCHMLYQYHTQWAATQATANGLPYWIVPHGSLDPYVFSYRSIRKRTWVRAVGRAILGGAARVLFATHRELEKAQEEVGRLRNAVVVPWPTATVDLADRGVKRAAVRCALGVPASERVLLYCGRLHSSKRVLETIRFVAAAADRAVSLVVMGPDGDVTAEDCRDLARAHNWHNVFILGPVYGAQKYDYFKAADAFISLSHKENFGHAVAEGLACGLPVILSPGVDLASELSAVECGWLLREVDASGLASVLQAFASMDRTMLETMGENGRAWATTRLSVPYFASELQRMACDDVGGHQ